MRSLKYVVIMSFLTVILIIVIPILILSYTLLPYDIIHYSNHFHSYKDPYLIDELNINVDIGNIKINYITQPVDFCVKIDVDFELGGFNLENKSFSDFFEIKWQSTSSKLNFTMQIKNWIELDKILSQIRVFDIDISFKADINCDVNILVNYGNVGLDAIYGVFVRNIFSNVSKGDIRYQFSYNQINGNITGIVEEGNISFKTDHIQYTKNCILTFINNYGHTLIDIFQDCEFGANITGVGTTISGIIELIYKDYSQNIGAQFILYNKRDLGNEADNDAVGFENEALPSAMGQKFYSYDFPTQNNYNFSLYKPYPSDMGDFIWDLYSIPSSKP
jgi:hypothetical protein